jgi:hypothetical protein
MTEVELTNNPDTHPIATGVGAAGAAAGDMAGDTINPTTPLTPKKELAPVPEESSSSGPMFHVGI